MKIFILFLCLALLITLVLLIIVCFNKDNFNDAFVNNLIITTTFRNKSRLLIPFYKFYKDIWKPNKFIFIVGLDNKDRVEYINNINNIFNSKFIEVEKFKNNIEIKKFDNIILYSNNDDILLLIYNIIESDMDGKYFERARCTLFKLLNKYYNKFKYKLNTDIDDFYYVKNITKYLLNYKENKNNHFHTVEFLPHKKFSILNDFNFISYHYYFKKRSTINKLSNHDQCRTVHLNSNVLSMHKSLNDGIKNKNYDICQIFDNKLNNNDFNTIEDFDRISFSFGCLDLDFLLKEKIFNVPKFKKITKKDIFFSQYYIEQKDFYKYPILKCNFLKKYFN